MRLALLRYQKAFLIAAARRFSFVFPTTKQISVVIATLIVGCDVLCRFAWTVNQRRSLTFKTNCTCNTACRRRAGLSSFPGGLLQNRFVQLCLCRFR